MLLLVVLAISLGCGHYVYGTTAFRQEADGIQAEQLIDYQAQNETAARIHPIRVHPAKSIKPIPPRIFSLPRHDVLSLLEEPFFTEAALPGFGQVIVSFLSRSRISHSDSEKPHLFSC